VQVSATLDANRIESRSETYDPESKVIRSSQNRTENSRRPRPTGPSPSATNCPAPGAGAGRAAEPEGRLLQERGSGQLRDLAHDAHRGAGGRPGQEALGRGAGRRHLYRSPAGELAYQPRPPEDLERIGQLVRMAVGFDQARGDKVEVVNLAFAEAPPAPTDLIEQS
jgi:flagellar M-ring protein FliF